MIFLPQEFTKLDKTSFLLLLNLRQGLSLIPSPATHRFLFNDLRSLPLFLIIVDASCIGDSTSVFKRALLTHLNRLARGVLEVLLTRILVIVFEVGYTPDKER